MASSVEDAEQQATRQVKAQKENFELELERLKQLHGQELASASKTQDHSRKIAQLVLQVLMRAFVGFLVSDFVCVLFYS